MAVIRRTSAGSAPASPSVPVPTASSSQGAPVQPVAAGPGAAGELSRLTADAITYWLFNAPADQGAETARVRAFIDERRAERESTLTAAKEKVQRVLTAGFLAGAKPEDIAKRADELVSIAVAELRRPLTEPQMVDLMLASTASLEAAFLKLSSFNIPVCSAANLARFTVRKSNGAILVQPQPEIGGLFDAAQGVVARMEGAVDGASPKFGVSAHAVREQDFFCRTTTEEKERVEFRPNDRPDPAKTNAYVGAFAVVRAGSQLPLIVYLTEAVIASRTNDGALGKNRFYAKAPDRELTNIVTREALRRFLLERANSFVHRLASLDLGVQTMFEDDHGSAPTPGQHAAKFAVAVSAPEPDALSVEAAPAAAPASAPAESAPPPAAPAPLPAAGEAPNPAPGPEPSPAATAAAAPTSAADAPPAPSATPAAEAPKRPRGPRRQAEAAATPAESSSSPAVAPLPAPQPVPLVIRPADPQEEEELALS